MTNKTIAIKTSPEMIYREYQEGIAFNQSIDLYETVEQNNNFYNDKHWEGVNAPNLDKPVINFIKPAVNYYIAQLVSDDIGVNLELPWLAENKEQADYVTKVVQKEIYNTLEATNSSFKHRQLLKNMAVDGDMVLYSYFDPEIETGEAYKGAIRTEIVYNTDIYFGNPMEPDIQKQPYIIIKQRRQLASVQEEAKSMGVNPKEIAPDEDDVFTNSGSGDNGQKYVTVLIKFWRENKQVHYTKVAKNAVLKPKTNLEYSLYPISYGSWETVKNSYHGISPITGKIKNQIFVNKLYAMAMAYTQNMAFPKVIYDKTKLPGGWSNDTTKAIGVNGNPQEAIFSTFRAADMSGQVMGLIKETIANTKESLGVFDAALGNVRPDNTSAIVAVQKAAAMPLDLQRLDFYRFVEDTVRIWLDIMTTDYGLRKVQVEGSISSDKTEIIPTLFDFGELKSYQYNLTIDIGSSAYWSELMQIQTLDNLMNRKIIPDPITYLENVPEGYIKGKQKLIDKLKEQQQVVMPQSGMSMVNGGVQGR